MMQGHVSELENLAGVSGFLVGWYLIAALANGGAAVYWWRQRRAPGGAAGVQAWLPSLLWLAAAAGFLGLSAVALSGQPSALSLLSLPQPLRDAADRVLGPTLVMVGAVVLLVGFYFGRQFFVRSGVAWSVLNLALLGLGLSLTDPDFVAIVARPDNVPIVGLVFLLGFFTWLAARQAVRNDRRLARHEPPLEAVDQQRVLVWPDLVYIELICMVALMTLLLVWSILLKAPLEQPASTVQTPNPSKAPWYFLGLQELLMYFDPWMAGVVVPALIIFGLMVLPYLDVNAQGNGYYTIAERKFAYLAFQFGFLVLWIVPMLLGTFCRGPNWSFFGLYETWDVHKVEALNNVQLSERFWIDWLGRPLPAAPAGAAGWQQLCAVMLRESPGLVLLGVYLLVLPGALARYSRPIWALRNRQGRCRYWITLWLLLLMALLPLKMLCRWLFNMNYFVAIPEYFFNI